MSDVVCMDQSTTNQLCFKSVITPRVIVVNQVTTAYRVASALTGEESLLCNFRRLDPAGQGLITLTAERLAAG